MERKLAALSPRTRWLGARIEVRDSIDSTHHLAEKLAEDGAEHGLVVIADQQSAGRGRLGRSFFSPPGCSIYISVLLRPRATPEELHRHIFAGAVSVAETVQAQLPDTIDITIKWPNDVQLDGRKTCGINLPARIDDGQVQWALLGIGLNVNTSSGEFPEELQELATSLKIASGHDFDRIAITEDLLQRLETQVDRIQDGDWNGVLERWRDFFKMEGAEVVVGGPGLKAEKRGVVSGVTPEGALLLDTDQGYEVVLAGDVTLARRPKAGA